MTSWTENEKVRVAPVQNFDVLEGQDHENDCVDSAHAPGTETVYIAPARVLDAEERSDHERSGHVRKVGNCVPCVEECAVTFALTQQRHLEDPCQLTNQDHMFQECDWLLMIHSSLSRERQDIFWLLIIKRTHQKKSTPSCQENKKQSS